MSTSRITQSQITDPRCWSFARRALAEKRSETKRKPFWFWIEVELPNQKKQWYQLPKDLQFAMRQYLHEQPKEWAKVLNGALINVPQSDYDDQGYASLTLGMIRQVKIRRQHTSISRQVSRSQFIMPEWTWYGLANKTQIKRFMFHDHDTGNRKNILAALRHWEIRFLLKKYFKIGDF